MMLGRPKLGTHRMVTVATRVEPAEVQKLRELADECGLSICAYMRELVRLELNRANRNADLYRAPANGNAKSIDNAQQLVRS
jgi:hypothetical protein